MSFLFGRRTRTLGRYREVLTVLIKYGLDDLLHAFNMARLRPPFLRVPKPPPGETWTRAARVRMAMEELGPTYVKLGQMLSTRPDLLPAEWIAQFERLQDAVPPFPTAEVRAILEREWRQPVGAVVRELDEAPVAAASVAQVHRAVLGDGREVALKVRRPGVVQRVEADLEILFGLARLLERQAPELALYDLSGIAREFARTIRRELDFTLEARNLERFGRDLEGRPLTRVPFVVPERSTVAVLVMEFVHGTKISDVAALRDAGLDLKELAGRGADLVIHQVLDVGFFHADPHPGNLLVGADGVIHLLDCGMVGRLKGRTRDLLVAGLSGVVRGDAEALTRVLMAFTDADGELPGEALEADVAELLDTYFNLPLRLVSVAGLLRDFFQLVERNRLRFKPDLVMLGRALGHIEAIGRRLDPEFDLVAHARPAVGQLIARRHGPRRLARRFLRVLEEGQDLLEALPGDLRTVLRMVRQNRVEFGFRHRGLEEPVLHLERAVNRAVLGMIACAFLVGSALLYRAGIGPHYRGIPVAALVGFGVSALFLIRIFFSILRGGRL